MHFTFYFNFNIFRDLDYPGAVGAGVVGVPVVGLGVVGEGVVSNIGEVVITETGTEIAAMITNATKNQRNGRDFNEEALSIIIERLVNN